MSVEIVRRVVPENHGVKNIAPILARIFAARGLKSEDELDLSLGKLFPASQLFNIDKAVERIFYAMKNHQRILIVGDFDADGATSSALAVSALKAMAAEKVSFIVPNRFTYGYGLTPEIVDVAAKQKPGLLITVDNGISSVDGVDRANALGIDVVVTDHHLPAEKTPNAYAIVNPNQQGSTFPSKNLAGVGVIFYVMVALRGYCENQNWFTENKIKKPNMAEFLDLVALGTIADVVALDRNNRILVQQGLQRIRHLKARPGIQALLKIANKEPKNLVAMDLGFSIGPRLNAAGRLDDMSLGIACLLERDFDKACVMARELDQLNQERKNIEVDMQRQAFDAVDRLNLTHVSARGLCLFEEEWHQGVVGLVASRVKEKTHRPVIAFALSGENELKGSARSVPGLHIRDVFANVAARYPDLILKFGGHAMAAGLSIAKDKLATFSKAFADEVAKQLNEADLKCRIESDGELSSDEMTLELAELISNAGPWGQAFPEPIFDGEFDIVSQRIVGECHLKLILRPQDSDICIDAIAFKVDLNEWPNYHCNRIRAAYRLDINIYNGCRRLQLLIEHMEQLTLRGA